MSPSPVNPSEPDVNVASFHGPFGDKSVNVIATKIAPKAAKPLHSAFADINGRVGRDA
tara:strand:- start:2374 stop:2547 length:174 start_codon:yes stop_codon:yes gene_type:complete